MADLAEAELLGGEPTGNLLGAARGRHLGLIRDDPAAKPRHGQLLAGTGQKYLRPVWAALRGSGLTLG